MIGKVILRAIELINIRFEIEHKLQALKGSSAEICARIIIIIKIAEFRLIL